MIKLAFDRSMRTIDADGRLHVALSNISKVAVNPYLGSEIPNAAELGLDPGKIYNLLRHPAELEKAAPTFNNLPVLSTHVYAGVDKPPKDLIIGSTGTDACYTFPYLQNSLVVWDSVAIAGINTREQCELSSAYRYTPIMTPGVYEGVAYDGIMTDIIGNHVAVVETGRAGPDVVVGDSRKPLELITMKLSRTAVAVNAAIGAYIAPRLAADAAIGDTKPFVRGVTAATFAQDKARILTEVGKKFDGVKADELGKIIQLAADSTEDDPKEPTAQDEDEQREGESDDDYAKRKAKKLAGDGDPSGDPDNKTTGTAMDAAGVATLVSQAETRTMQKMQAIRVAEREVAPYIGEVVSMDSADKVYKAGLDHYGVNVEGVHTSAYRAMFLQAAAHAAKPQAPRVAQDAAPTDFASRYPTAGTLKRSI